ncbi:serine hydrolase [Methanobacterium alkalithermotolerans]|uniref:Serine hydrolase n=1 Tax=Methanobacterium alkalithermotolerans TaxID=2731220 RepID=A0A8T8K3X1_9EURY|nr:serine hydrolase [Methanobacterium alkalithermotolerans]QUH22687.1 serine hydrolase [Methanobacterium alkalithermotolerans]
MLDIKILAALIIIMALGAIAGILVYNNMNPETTGTCKPLIGLDNKSTTNNTPDNINNYFTSDSLFDLNSYSPKSDGHFKPSPGPVPQADPINRVISLFDAYLKSIFNESGVPGSAVVIVKDKEIIYMITLGVKDLSSGAPVTKDTLFEIGSCTKAFTATNMAQLVSAGLMSWDDPISKYYNNTSQFQMYDPSITGNLTILDCLSHRSGQPEYSQDMEWILFNNSYSPMLYNLRYVKNNTPFGSTYGYNNIIYSLPGYCAAQATNTTWSDLIKEYLLNPLGMNTATSTVKDFFNSPDHSTPYRLLGNGTLIPYQAANLDAVGPAGVISASISEMAHWLKFQIAGTGYYNGVPLVSKENLDKTRTGQIYAPGLGGYYGLGWIISNLSFGNKSLDVITHSGDTLSSQTVTSIFPTEGLGMVVLTNVGPTGLDFGLTLFSKLFTLICGYENYDPWPIYKDMNKPVPYPAPTPPFIDALGLGNYTGVYNNYLYGNITITTDNNVLTCYFGNNLQPYTLEHWNANLFLEPSMDLPLNFTHIHDGCAQQLVVEGISDYSTLPAETKSVFNRTNSTS